jgi:creatinine amidohydrolase
MNRLADRTWPDVPTSGCTVLVPVGSLEQHGPHLPLDTDTVIAQAVCDRLAATLDDPDVVVAPAVAFGSSGEHQHFAGTSSLGTEVLRMLLIELTRSMDTWAGRVVYVNGHGGNVGALESAVGQLRAEGHDVAWLPCATEDVDLHAGRTETSLMLHLRPERVSLERAERGNTRSLAELMPAMLAGGVRTVSPNGVLGDPTGATPHEGARVLEDMCGRLVGLIRLPRRPSGAIT